MGSCKGLRLSMTTANLNLLVKRAATLQGAPVPKRINTNTESTNQIVAAQFRCFEFEHSRFTLGWGIGLMWLFSTNCWSAQFYTRSSKKDSSEVSGSTFCKTTGPDWTGHHFTALFIEHPLCGYGFLENTDDQIQVRVQCLCFDENTAPWRAIFFLFFIHSTQSINQVAIIRGKA